MSESRPVIISCAVTGGIHTPTMSDHLPITADDIARQSIEAAAAGAAIIHIHARSPLDGRPTGDPDVFVPMLSKIKRETNVVLNVTTGGSPIMHVDERIAAAVSAHPELASLNMGSINFAIFPIASKYDHWKFDWEESFVRGTEDLVFKNTFKDIKHIINELSPVGTRFEHECYDVGHLYNLSWFVDQGLIKPPFFIQLVLGVMGGIGADVENLRFMKLTADRLFGDDYQWSALAAGRQQMSIGLEAAKLGGHVRVGLEDSLFLERGRLATSNAEQVQRMVDNLAAHDMRPATANEARDMLGLKGSQAVNF